MHSPDIIADTAVCLQGKKSDRSAFKTVYGVDVTKVESLTPIGASALGGKSQSIFSFSTAMDNETQGKKKTQRTCSGSGIVRLTSEGKMIIGATY